MKKYEYIFIWPHCTNDHTNIGSGKPVIVQRNVYIKNNIALNLAQCSTGTLLFCLTVVSWQPFFSIGSLTIKVYLITPGDLQMPSTSVLH